MKFVLQKKKIQQHGPIWTNSDEEHATLANFDENTKCEQFELSDFSLIAYSTGGSVSSCIDNMEDQYYIQQCIHTFTLRKSVAQNTLKENSPKTNIKLVSKKGCKDASNQLSKGDFWMPLQELKISSHYLKYIL